MMSSKIYKLFLFLFYFVSVISGNDVIVETDKGKVAGKVVKSIIPNEKYFSFLGIPYAAPPLEELRFMPPQPHPGWDNVLSCKKERLVCAQYVLPARLVKNYGFAGSEDCLHINVHTPVLPKNNNPNLPVIFFVMNDNFKVTPNFTIDYSPDFFMKEDVIVVHINHRLGSLGFLSFEDDLLPGNNGLRDVIMALEWVQKNIYAFGGDPSRVTLMGHQGGAVIADILLHSEKAEGLFSRVIMQSGTSWNSMYFGGKARHRAKELADALEWGTSNSETLVKYLRPLNASFIIQNEPQSVHADEARAVQRGIPEFGPVIEHFHADAVITEMPEESYIHNNVPIMIGYNSRESIDACSRYLIKPSFLTYANRDFLFMFPIRTNYHFKINDQVYFEAVEEVKEFYFEEGYVKVSQPGEYLTYIQDVMRFYPIDYTVRQYVERTSSPIYYYMFDYSGEWNQRKKEDLEKAINLDGTWGATLTDELCYLFICNKYKSLYAKALGDSESEEYQVLQNMVRLWTNFAKSGNPTPPGDVFEWKPATKENKECLVVNEELELKTRLHDENVAFWDDFIERHGQKAVDGVVYDVKDEL